MKFQMKSSTWIVIAGVLGASGVLLGAYHAHGLEKMLASQQLDVTEINKRMDQCAVAVRYQMIHALGLVCVGLLAGRGSRRYSTSGTLFTVGTVLFSGGLYLNVFTGNMIHWAIVPSGGLLLAAAWVALAVTAWRDRGAD
jgi:uncharacterized membrane protein YgdD (TMEM256/DUF423 family)